MWSFHHHTHRPSIAQSPRVERVFCAPGNAGTELDGVNVPIDVSDLDGLLKFARKEQIGLTVVGPEDPLAGGIVDFFQKNGQRIFGPTQAAAQIEASKARCPTAGTPPSRVLDRWSTNPTPSAIARS